jgi:hypothetical protein
VAFVVPTNSEGDPQGLLWLVPSATVFYLLLLLTIGTPIFADWLNKRW